MRLATGVDPKLTWADLESLDINDGPSTYQVRVRSTVPGQSPVTSAAAAFTVTNTAPAAVLTGDLTATVGEPFRLKVGADDPSSADMAAQFRYRVNWGDGSPVLNVDGPADPPVTHIYPTAGRYAASFAVTDQDGGTGRDTEVVVVSQAALVPTPTPTPTTTASYSDDSDSDDFSSDTGLASTGSTVGPGTLVAALLLLGVGAGLVVAGRRGSRRHQG